MTPVLCPKLPSEKRRIDVPGKREVLPDTAFRIPGDDPSERAILGLREPPAPYRGGILTNARAIPHTAQRTAGR